MTFPVYQLLPMFLLLIGPLVVQCNKTLPESWTRNLQEECEKFEQDPKPGVPLIQPHLVATTEVLECPILSLMPSYILLSPVEQYGRPYHMSYNCPKCEPSEVSRELKPVGWQDGRSGQQSMPRRIHGIETPVLLVGRVYRCPSKRTVLAYNPGLLAQIPLQGVLPFELWLRTGFTTNLIRCIHTLLLAGVSVSGVVEWLRRRRAEFYISRCQTLLSIKSHFNAVTFPYPTEDEYRGIWGDLYAPSRHSIASIFLLNFWKRNAQYDREMSKLTIQEDAGWLSCDHTFTSVSKL